MKTGSLIILLGLFLSVCSQATVTHTHAGEDASLATLDVCQSAGTAICSDDDDMPVIDECPYKAYDLEFAGCCDISGYLSARDIFSFQRERPPRHSRSPLPG